MKTDWAIPLFKITWEGQGSGSGFASVLFDLLSCKDGINTDGAEFDSIT